MITATVIPFHRPTRPAIHGGGGGHSGVDDAAFNERLFMLPHFWAWWVTGHDIAAAGHDTRDWAALIEAEIRASNWNPALWRVTDGK